MWQARVFAQCSFEKTKCNYFFLTPLNIFSGTALKDAPSGSVAVGSWDARNEWSEAAGTREPGETGWCLQPCRICGIWVRVRYVH